MVDLTGYAYFLATLVDFFGERLDLDELRVAIEQPESGIAVETLARARQAFAIDARRAWEEVSRFRRDSGLETVEEPLRALEPEPAKTLQ